MRSTAPALAAVAPTLTTVALAVPALAGPSALEGPRRLVDAATGRLLP
ncbi:MULTISPECIES: hypothetical protein [unclassified Streptomyces]|nr:hypothetical protein OG299_06115 [Streptomyces sp. NBC_01296]